MADFEKLLNSDETEEIKQETEEIQQETEEIQKNSDEKINITELFDADLIADLFNKTIDFTIVSGLLLIAKQKGVNISRKELELEQKQKIDNKVLIEKVVHKIKIPMKLVGTILFTIAILSKYVDSYRKIESKKELINNNNEIIGSIKEENRNEQQQQSDIDTKKRGRGRPKGSKNKKHTINV